MREFPSLVEDEHWQLYSERHALTPRETEVLRLITAGLAYEAVCERLAMSRATLKTHLRAAYQKAGCASRVELILLLVHEFRPLGCDGQDGRG